MGEQSEWCLLLIMDDENWLRLSAQHEIICMCMCGGRFSVFTCGWLDRFYVFKLPHTHIYLHTSGSRCPFPLRGKGQTQILAEFGTLWLIDRLFGCYERPRKPGHICGGDTRGNTRMTWQSRCKTSFNTCLGRQAQQWNVWWFNVMLAFWLIVLSVHHGYLRSFWRLSWISLWQSKKYLFLCFTLHHLWSSYNNHKRWKILRM